VSNLQLHELNEDVVPRVYLRRVDGGLETESQPLLDAAERRGQNRIPAQEADLDPGKTLLLRVEML
jgi:hypothetical protein